MDSRLTMPQTIDVIIPVYNGAHFVLEAIESVGRQTLRPNSIIVIDDGSTDSTADVIEKYNGPVPLDYVRQDNRGLSAARNAGWKKSRAEYVAFLDADDIWQPGKLAAQMTVFQKSEHSDLYMVYCGYHLIDQAGQSISVPHLPIIHPRLRGRVFDALLPINVISGSGSAVLIRRTALEAAGGFDESLPALEDWDMWLRLAQAGSIDFSSEDLVGIRTHAASMQRDSKRMMTATMAFFSRWLERLPPNIQPPTVWVKTLARYAANSWPPSVFWKAMSENMSADSRQRLKHFIGRHMLAYFIIRCLSLPFEWIVRRPWRDRRT